MYTNNNNKKKHYISTISFFLMHLVDIQLYLLHIFTAIFSLEVHLGYDCFQGVSLWHYCEQSPGYL